MPSFKSTDIPDLTGRVAIVTGGNSGLGEVSCLELARKGAKVYMASRTESKAQDAIAKIKQAVPNADIHFLQLDLTELAAVRKAAEDYISREKRLDILLNNAGVMATPYTFTKDGLELQVGTNVVGHYLFTMLLLPTLISTSKLPEYAKPDSPSVRVVQVSSLGHIMSPGDTSFKDLDAVNKKYWPEVKATFDRYGKSKLGNVLIANELARLVPSDARIVNISIHPGVVRTGLIRGMDESYGKIVGSFNKLASRFFTAPEDGALTQLYACASPEVDRLDLNGAYLVPVAKVGGKSKLAQDKEGKLGAELFSFCNSFIKEKLNLDVAEHVKETGVQLPQSHL
ncbi:Short-chain dehydrogenase/reductase SDR [Kalmanozyma brasiliensis GHG001]|uniref:Short-chain dehydrogenase n=1 Tax=Kalmanozyma brasiliensis (strain GHG001) TaxID=1365824 RepID=V5GPD0_KALBG|nr:Short-chain dehydrogenase/reductase SDR [Kalmanozyma brasiliensis GHG001]EST07827.1 Short-chain dehydrogenase/reductase SDR [Kalmanozyma brasiliensis GHG001]